MDFDFRTQFLTGYNYKSNPFEDDREPPVRISDNFAPAYFAESVNISFNKGKWLRSSVGIGLKQIIVDSLELRKLYDMEEDGAVKFKFGIFSKLKFEREIFNNVKLNSIFDFFMSAMPFQKPDFRWNNKLDMKVNSWLQITIELEYFYDSDIIDKLQVKEVMSLGFVLNIIKAKAKP